MSNNEGTRTPYDPPYTDANYKVTDKSYGVANSYNPPYSEANYGVANNLPEAKNSYGVAGNPYRTPNNLPDSGFEQGEFSPAAPGALGSK